MLTNIYSIYLDATGVRGAGRIGGYCLDRIGRRPLEFLRLLGDAESGRQRWLGMVGDDVRMGVKRRMGPQNSTSRDVIFDAVERVLQKEGYIALTARRVAEEAGFNHQTVYYYFETMEELILGAFRRRSEGSLKRLEAALAADRPLHAIWAIYSDPSNGRLNIEFNALAMRNEPLRLEITQYLERSRSMQEAALAPLLKELGLPDAVGPMVPGMLILFVANFLDREAALGVTKGHGEMEAFVDWCLGRFELRQNSAEAVTQPL